MSAQAGRSREYLAKGPPDEDRDGLTVVAIGAILAFAVTAQPSFFSFHMAGWVLMLTGAAGVAIPRRGYGWLRRRLVLNTGGRTARSSTSGSSGFSRLLVPGGIITEAPEAPPWRRPRRLRSKATRSSSTSRSERRNPRGLARAGLVLSRAAGRNAATSGVYDAGTPSRQSWRKH